jgi:crotonobetainyl-CoA:carnitine CoA-transferase CaiB-like acyl-CoA transferase
LEPQFFAQFCQALGHPEWAGRGLAINPEIQKPLKQDIARIIESQPFAHWLRVFAELDCCVEPVLGFHEACAHEQIQSRELLIDLPIGNAGKEVRQIASALKFSATQPSYRFAGSRLGAHTDEVLLGNGFSESEVAELRKAGAIL